MQADFLERKLRTSGHRLKLGVAAWEEWSCRPHIMAASDFDVALDAIEDLPEGPCSLCHAITSQLISHLSVVALQVKGAALARPGLERLA